MQTEFNWSFQDPHANEDASQLLCAFCLSGIDTDKTTPMLLPCLCPAHLHCYNQVFHTSLTLSMTNGIVTCGSCSKTMTVDSNGAVILDVSLEPSILRLYGIFPCNTFKYHIVCFIDSDLSQSDLTWNEARNPHAQWKASSQYTALPLPSSASPMQAPVSVSDGIQSLISPPRRTAERRIAPILVGDSNTPPKGSHKSNSINFKFYLPTQSFNG